MVGPILLVAGGSGIVPLISMIRHRAAAGSKTPARLLYSARTPEDVIYYDELIGLQSAQDGLEVAYTFTRRVPAGWTGYARRIDAEMLGEVAGPFGSKARAYICGPTLMVESAADGLLQVGLAADQIRTERFGPTGGN